MKGYKEASVKIIGTHILEQCWMDCNKRAELQVAAILPGQKEFNSVYFNAFKKY
jgi:hypothetical protein